MDIDRARRETPGCTRVTHFNNAGAALMPTPVIDEVKQYLDLEALTGGYEAEEERHDDIERFYSSVANLLNCSSKEIAFIENATRAWDMAFYSMEFKQGDRILTSVAEYASNYIAFLQVAKQTGATIEVIPDDEHGQLSVDALEKMMDSRVKLIAITHVPTNGGLVNPAEKVGAIARSAGVTYILDACQSVGQMPIDVRAIGCDVLSFTGRKFLRGPRGTGALYISEKLLSELEPVFLDLQAATWQSKDSYTIRGDARKFETWECNFAAKLGLTRAIEYAVEWGIEAIEERISKLAQLLREQLAAIEGVAVRDIGLRKCGIVSFTSPIAAEEMRKRLRAQKINVSTSTPFGTRIDMERRGLKEVVRASVHYYNTEDEIAVLCEAVRQGV